MSKQLRIWLFVLLSTLLTSTSLLAEGVITLTTSKAVGEEIRLSIEANGSVSITGVRESALTDGSSKYYTLTSQTITILGDVTMLKCSNRYNRCVLTSLDASGCTALKTLDCRDNKLTSLNASGCTSLTTLDCQKNKLTSLNVSGCIALTKLDCSDNRLTSLDVSGCTALTKLDCRENELTRLNVSSCTALTQLYCGHNQLTSLDVSKNTALTELNCSGSYFEKGGLTSLDVSKNTALTTLDCFWNQLTSLDVSKNTALTTLNCGGNQLTSLDVSKNTALTTLNCGGNQLTSLDVSKNTALTTLNCGGNQLTSLNVSGCTALTTLDCNSNQLTSLDASGCTALKTLDCRDNKLTSLNASGCTSLTTLDCRDNKLTSLNVSGCTALTSLNCQNNQLTSLDVSGCTALTHLYCQSNQLTSLKASGCTALTTLDYSSNPLNSINLSGCQSLKEFPWAGGKLISLDVSGCTALTKLDCQSNELTSLDVSGCTALKKLYCKYNQLASLDVSSCTALTTLDCDNNQLTSLNVSGCTSLTGLYCWYNQLTSLSVSGCTALTELSCDFNPLTSVNLSGCESLKKFSKRRGELTSLDATGCTALTEIDCQDNPLTSIKLSGCKSLKGFSWTGGKLTSLDVSGCTALRWLNCSYNQLTSLDVSSCIALTTLDCSGNPLNNLDVFKNTALTTLDCSSNQLTSLDISKNTALTMLKCWNNKLTSLDVSTCSQLNYVDCSVNQIKEEAMTQLVSSLPTCRSNYHDRDGRYKYSGGYFIVVSNFAQEGNFCSKANVASARAKNWNSLKNVDEGSFFAGWGGLRPYEGEDSNLQVGSGVITMITTKAVGKTIALAIKADGGVTIEGAKTPLQPDGNIAYYTLTSQTITIRGDVTRLSCSSLFLKNSLTSLSVSGCTALTELNCDYDQLASLDVSGCTALTELKCEGNQLTSLDVSSCTALTTLYCHNNQLTSLDVSGCTSLTKLNCYSNQLTSLDVSKNTALTELYCYTNQLTSLDVSKNTALTELQCQNNQLTSLDVSSCTALTKLQCYNNRINGDVMTKLVNSLPNRKGKSAGSFEVMQNTPEEKNLCRPSDLAIAKEKNWDSQWSDGSPYSISIGKGVSTMTTAKATGETIDLSIKADGDIIIKGVKDTPLPDGKIHRCTLTSQTITILGDVTELKCYDNQLTNLDISRNPTLTTLVCYKNRINGEAMTQLVNSLPNRTGMSAGTLIVMQDTPEEKNLCRPSDLAIAKEKNWNSQWSDGSLYSISIGNSVSTMTTAKAIGETIDLSIKANGDIIIKGVKDTPLPDGKSHRCTLTSQTVTILGDVTELKCSGNQLTDLDLTRSTALTSLNCSSNQLTSSDLSKSTALNTLDCSNNQLASLDLSKNAALNTLNCSNNQLTSVDLSKSTALNTLDCSNNQLTSVDLLGCSTLTELNCQDNPLTSINLSRCRALEKFSWTDGKLTSLDVSRCTALATLTCYNNQLTSLDVSGCISLGKIECYNNRINGEKMTNLVNSLPNRKGMTAGVFKVVQDTQSEKNLCRTSDITIAKEKNWNPLEASSETPYIGLGEGIITMTTAKAVGETIALKVEANGKVIIEGAQEIDREDYDGKKLYRLSSQTITIRGDVTTLDCPSNSLLTLDVSGCTVLTKLYCSNNQLTSLDVSSCIALEELGCFKNQLTSLDVSKQTSLTTLYCSSNQLTSLDVSKQTSLTTLYCSNNKLTSLDVSGCTALTKLGVVEYGYGNQTTLASLKASGCTALTELNCQNIQLTSLDVSGCTALTKLDCSKNKLTSLDVSSCTALKELGCYNNQLTSLKVSKSTALAKISCYNNRINGEEMTNLVNSLPNRNGMSPGDLFVVCNDKGEENWCSVSDVLIARGKNWNTKWQNGDPYKGVGSGVITMTTAKAIGETIKLGIKASDAIFIDGVRGTLSQDGTMQSYTLTSNTLTIRGNVVELSCAGNQLTSLDVSSCTSLISLNCQNNELTSLDVSSCISLISLNCQDNKLASLDVSRNSALTTLDCNRNQLSSLKVSGCTVLTKLNCAANKLESLPLLACISLTELNCEENQLTGLNLFDCKDLKSLYCIKNKLNGKAMSSLIESLPDRTGRSEGRIKMYSEYVVSDETFAYQYDVRAAQKKNWRLFYNDSTPYKGAPNPICSVTKSVEGKGSLSITGAIDLGVVAYGTKLTVVATPKANYELVSLTANGVDILATKEFVVKEDVTVEAVFSGHTFNVALEKEGAGELIAVGLDDTHEAAYGTELTIVATPAADYELTALTANGRDILATKKVVVTENMTIKATFTKKSFAVTFDKEGEGTISATGASSLNAVAYGTELTIVATPAEGYELTALTANGTDILATKKVVVEGNLTVKATFTKKSFAVTFDKVGEGTITATGASNLNSVAYGTELTIVATPAEGYELTALTANGTDILATKKVVVEGNLTVKATFTKKNFAVSLTKEGEGAITATGASNLNSVAYGTELTIVATPAKGYELVSITANGADITATKKVVVTGNLTVKATFAKKSFAVSLTKVGKGTITATGASNLNSVAYGTELTISATPAEGYELTALTANGTDILATKKVVVEGNLTVKATFAKKNFAVSLTKEGEGRISATGASNLNSVAYGTELTINATPAEGYELTALTANGTDITATKKVVVTDNLTVKATFAKKNFAVSLTKEGEGTITATGASNLNSVAYGTELTIVATPAEGYELTALTANGTDILATKKVVVEGNLTVKATFEKKTFAVTLTSNDHGDITIAEPVNLDAVPYGTTLTVKATGKNAQCVLTELTANGEDILATRSFVVTDVTEVKATFVDHTGVETTVTQQTQLYPNPATDYVIVEGVAPASEVTLHSMTGERLYAGRADSRGTLQIDLTPYADGVYLVCVAGETYRVVVRH